MESKKFLGQFYTTNSEYILQGLVIPNYVDVIEPFVGQGDISSWVKNNFNVNSLETYDIDPKIKCDDIRNSIINPPSYRNKWVVTNPPFLAKNKNNDKTIYNKFAVDDLYKAFLITLIDGDCEGGIIILPLNFFSSEDGQMRNRFLSKYKIEKVNIFEEKVFEDTAYTVCSFQFSKGENITKQEINFRVFPSNKNIKFTLSHDYGFRIGGNELNCKNTLKLGRLLIGQKSTTNMTLFAVDSGTFDGRIKLKITDTPYFGKESDRVFCTITSPFKIENEEEICKLFNEKLEILREKYNSMFLTNYRESTKNYSRKRISFKQAFCLLNQIINELNY